MAADPPLKESVLSALKGKTGKKARVADYLRRLSLAREVRDATGQKLFTAIVSFIGEIELLEQEVCLAAAAFKSGRIMKVRATRNFGLAWKDIGVGPGMLTPLKEVAWYVVDRKGGLPKRADKPTLEQLSRTYETQSVHGLVGARDRLDDANKKLREFRTRYKGLNKAIGPSVYFRTVIKGMTGKIPAWVPSELRDMYESRLLALEMVSAEIEARLERVREIEVVLGELVSEFNSQGDRWQNHLTATWRLPREGSINVTGGSGPHFYKLKKGNGKRLLVRVDGKVTRELIRECGQGRYEEVMLSLYRKICILSVERERISESFVGMYRILRPYI
jgi:hypothetical protein